MDSPSGSIASCFLRCEGSCMWHVLDNSLESLQQLRPTQSYSDALLDTALLEHLHHCIDWISSEDLFVRRSRGLRQHCTRVSSSVAGWCWMVDSTRCARRCVCWPTVGRHLVFDGRLLHGVAAAESHTNDTRCVLAVCTACGQSCSVVL